MGRTYDTSTRRTVVCTESQTSRVVFANVVYALSVHKENLCELRKNLKKLKQ
jgi:hypothetical protein